MKASETSSLTDNPPGLTVSGLQTSTTHTPGPWNYCQESVDPEWWIVTIQGGLIVANVNAHHRQIANARLIASAPDMLAALKAAAPELFGKARQQVLDAIEKAEGEK